MNLISICLLLPVASIVALPSQYSYYTKDGEQQELPNEFWCQHFGPDFQHALHFQLGQSEVVDNENSVAKNMTENTNSGNKKRSPFIVHQSQQNEQNVHEAMGNSMRVHLLQPEEMEALEREMLNYARGNGMIQSPVVVNLPESEGSLSKNPGQDKPVVLNLPPIVYHSGVNTASQRYSSASPYANHAYSQSSTFYDQMQIPFHQISSYASMQSPYEIRKPAVDEVSPPESAEPRPKFDDAIPASPEETKEGEETESQDSSKAESKV